MNNGPLVSVIIPCYQQGHYLDEAIRSVYAQTYSDHEIIVINDGSTDNTAAVAAGYVGLTCIQQRNLGLPTARNVGLQASTGEYIVFLDADDRLLPEALETGLRCLRALPDCAFVYGFCDLIDHDGALLPPLPQTAIEQNHYRTLFKANYIWTPGAIIFRRSVFEQVGGFDQALVSGCEDWDLYLRIAKHCLIHCHGKVIVQYRKHRASMSANGVKMLRAKDVLFRKHLLEARGDRELEELCHSKLTSPLQLVLKQWKIQLFTTVRARTRLRALKVFIQQGLRYER